MRICLPRLAVVFALVLVCAASARAGTVYQIRAGDTSGQPNVFQTLADFQTAITNDPTLLMDGDVIELHNDDASLGWPLRLPSHLNLTFKSVGGQHTVSKGISALNPGLRPLTGKTLVIEDIRVVDGNFYGVYATNTSVVLKNSVVENNAGNGVTLRGNGQVTLVNTVFTNNGGPSRTPPLTNALHLTATAEDQTISANVVMDENANTYTHWASDQTDIAILVENLGNAKGMGTVDIGFNIAGGKTLTIDGDIISLDTNSGGPLYTTNTQTNITKTGSGVLKLRGGVFYFPNLAAVSDSGGNHLDIQEGTVHFGDEFFWSGLLPLNNGSIHVGKNGIFKPSVSASSNSLFLLDTFTSDKGSRLEVGGISALSTPPMRQYAIGSVANRAGTTVASTLSVNNNLMEAFLYLADDDTLALRILRVENLSSLPGVGSYADTYRRMTTLSEAERDMLDAIYNSGGTGDSLGFLQTVGGQIVQNSLLALRHNQANLLSKINTRLTKYQKEELEAAPEITGSDFLHYADEDPVVRYGELWAAIDQTWMDQKDSDDIAGHRYNAATLSIGYDRHWDNIIAGGVLNYASGTMKLRSRDATRTELSSLIAAAYASWAWDGWYVSGTVFAARGWNETESAFNLPGLAAAVANTGTYATSSYGANAEFGYMMETHLAGIPLRVTPYGGLTYARMRRDAVREGGAANLDRQFRAAVWSDWDMALGFRVAVPMEGDGYTLVPSLDAAWTRVMGDPRATGHDAYFIADPSTAWSIPLMSDSRNALRLAAGLDARFGNNITVGASYELEWRPQFWKNQLNLAASVDF